MTQIALHPLKRLHRDDRGNLGILLMLTLVALVAIIGVIWNSGEYATRRRHVQTAADSAAQAAALWTSRATNIVAQTNMLICQNGSAEVVYRSAEGTIQGIQRRLDAELQRVEKELEKIRQQAADNNKNPRGPDPKLGLRLQLLERVLMLVLSALPVQYNCLDEFTAFCAPALAAMSSSDFAARRQQIYDYQAQVLASTAAAVEQQRAALAAVYQCDLSLATPGGHGQDDTTSDRLDAAIKSVSNVNVEGVTVAGVSLPDPEEKRDIWITGSTWGAIDCPPLARYFNDRVGRDVAEATNPLTQIVKVLDEHRTVLGQAINQILTPPPRAPAWVIQVYVDTKREVDRMHLADRFARSLWSGQISGWRRAILRGMGDTPQHVLVTYNRYYVADWAKPAVYQDAYDYVYQWVYNHNYQRLYRQRLNELRRKKVPEVQAQQQAAAWAQFLASTGATMIAEQAALEWITRTWPYEIAPPEQPVPPTPGLSVAERQAWFTVLVAGKTTDASQAKPFMGKIFAAPTAPMASYAQAESFNWMEFNGGYGASDRYDRRMPPQPWRVSTIGGWTWQPRLALSDALDQALQNNPQFRSYFEQSGVSGNDSAAIQNLVTH